MAVSKRSFSRLEITKNLALISRDKINSKVTNLKLHDQTGRPCVLLLSWLMAKRKHMMKFVDYYLNKDCDVLCINVTPWQLLWPTKGTQVGSTITKRSHYTIEGPLHIDNIVGQ